MAVRRIIDEPVGHRQKRKIEYPPLGEILDALFKKEAGDSTEWDALTVRREAIKTKYPKE